MTCWTLALKRFLRPGTVLMLLLVMLTVLGGTAAGHQTKLRPCGVVCEDSHPDALRVQAILEEKGFPVYATREAMAADISYGKLDCGAVLLPGLGQTVEAGAPEGHLLLLTAPDTFLTEAYEAHLAAALYTAAAPAMTRLSAEEAGVTLSLEQIQAELDEMRREGYLFTFEITTADGAALPAPDLGLAIARAALGLLLFAAILPGTRRAVADMDKLLPRIGRRAAITGILIPSLFWQLVFFLLAGLVLPAERAALPGYLLLLTALGLIAARIPLELGFLLPILLLGALAVYPIYFDLAGHFPQLATLHWLLPPCWLLKAEEAPLHTAIAGAALLAAILAFYPAKRRK